MAESSVCRIKGLTKLLISFELEEMMRDLNNDKCLNIDYSTKNDHLLINYIKSSKYTLISFKSFILSLLILNNLSFYSDIEYLKANNCSFEENIQLKVDLIELIQRYINFFSCKCPFTSILDIIQIIQREEEQNNHLNLSKFIQQIKKEVKIIKMEIKE